MCAAAKACWQPCWGRAPIAPVAPAALSSPPAAAHPHFHPRCPQFPYPILNNLPFPLGFLAFVALGFAVVLSTFQLGKAVKTTLDSLTSGRSSGGSKNGGMRRRRSSGGGGKAKEQ